MVWVLTEILSLPSGPRFRTTSHGRENGFAGVSQE
jgi:hypothetical protein